MPEYALHSVYEYFLLLGSALVLLGYVQATVALQLCDHLLCGIDDAHCLQISQLHMSLNWPDPCTACCSFLFLLCLVAKRCCI